MLKKITEDNKIILLYLALILCALIKGISLPNSWTYSHFLFTYEFGFIKRALIGQLFHLADIEVFKSYVFFTAYAFTLLAINLSILFILISKLQSKGTQSDLFLPTIILLTSFAPYYFISSIGYAEQVGLLIVMLSLFINDFRKKAFFIFLTFPISLFVHEMFFIALFPFLFLSLLYSLITESDYKHGSNHIGFWQILTADKVKLSIVIVFAILCLSLTYIIASHSISPEHFQSLKNNAISQLGPLSRTEQKALDIFIKQGFMENINNVYIYWSTEPLHRFVIYMLFPLIWIYFFISNTCKRFNQLPRQTQKKLKPLLILTCLAPISSLLMNVLGYDTFRWATISIFIAYFSLVLMSKLVQDTQSEIQKNTQNNTPKNPSITWIILLIYIGASTNIDLYSGDLKVNQFPFMTGEIEYTKDLIKRRIPFETTY